jgi:hypothetical protein
MDLFKQIVFWFFALTLLGGGALLWVFGATSAGNERLVFLGIRAATWILIVSVTTVAAATLAYYKLAPSWGFVVLAMPVVAVMIWGAFRSTG